MSWPAPSPPRFATACKDEAHCGARPPVHIQVCSHLTTPTPKAGRSAVPSPLRGSNHPLWNGRDAHYQLCYDKFLPQDVVCPANRIKRLVPGGTRKLATEPCTPCVSQPAVYPQLPPGHAGTGAVGGVPAGPGWPAHQHIHSHKSLCGYIHGATTWGLPVHQPPPAAAARGQSSKKVSLVASSAGGASKYHHTHTCCLSQSAQPVSSGRP